MEDNNYIDCNCPKCWAAYRFAKEFLKNEQVLNKKCSECNSSLKIEVEITYKLNVRRDNNEYRA